jgi:pimeloyl-ACP methyl ester carboxylesterase
MMDTDIAARSSLSHRQLEAEGISMHVVEGGDAAQPAILFLHGWPENWATFKHVMIPLSDQAHVVAIDLPGIGDSKTPPPSNDKRTLAKYVRGLIREMGLVDVTLVGHDVGGMIVYAYLHAYPGELERAVIMNVAVPGVDPWPEIKRSPQIWHNGFHNVPRLPEILVTGHQAEYFAFFFDAISAKPDGVNEQARKTFAEAYLRPEALHTGFEWYRAFAQDEKDNLSVKGKPVQTPVLYLRGDKEIGKLEVYLQGLREGGLSNIEGRVIPGSGHFAPDEQPDAVVKALQEFLKLGARRGDAFSS